MKQVPAFLAACRTGGLLREEREWALSWIVSAGGSLGQQFAGVVDGAACISPYPGAVDRRTPYTLTGY